MANKEYTIAELIKDSVLYAWLLQNDPDVIVRAWEQAEEEFERDHRESRFDYLIALNEA